MNDHDTTKDTDGQTATETEGTTETGRTRVRTRRRTGTPTPAGGPSADGTAEEESADGSPAAADTAPAAGEDTPADAAQGAAAASDGGGDDGGASGGSGRRRRRSRRRRRAADTATPAATPEAEARPDEDGARPDAGEEAPAEDLERVVASGGTRVAAKQRANRGARRSKRRRDLFADLPDEVRRAVLSGAPRTMLVTRVADRIQIAVLEDRTLVEHYIARAEQRSLVGNIYMGRVQNVLPGMEAAFVDIGQGRNGVLYAGEVLYDESDLEDGATPRIEQALQPGQKVLVQVTKDPMGSKGPRLTMQLSLAGRYMVLAPNTDLFGISRKLPDEARDRLRRILRRIKPAEHGVIVRTAAEQASEEQLEADLERLLKTWEQVQERARDAKALEVIYEEPPLVVRVIRDHFSPDFEALIVDDEELHEQIRSYLEEVDPDQVAKVSRYAPTVEEGEQPEWLFDAYHVTDQLRVALDRKVTLPSGGYLVIDRTEAMTIIDVNTGRFTGSTSLEETVLRTNLEAAEEVVRQLRLRDIGGIIVIDFIDMLLPANQEQVLLRLRRELLRDRTKTRVSEVSRLGLVQMTRKNVSPGLYGAFTERCPECEGRGYRLTADWLR